MKPYCDELSETRDGNKAKRPGCVLARSDAAWELACHPLLVEALDGLLGRQVTMHDKGAMQRQLVKASYHLRPFKQHPYNLDITQMVACAPGAKAQSLHQDGGKHIFDFRGLLEPSVSTMCRTE